MTLVEESTPTLWERKVLLGYLWADTPRPCVQTPKEEWVRRFREVGYFDLRTLQPVPLPPRIKLYRGAGDGWERGMSWTQNAPLARYYGNAVWTTVVPAEAVLATLPKAADMSGGLAVEYVVDVPPDAVVVEASAVEIGGAGARLHFPGRKPDAVENSVRRFIRDTALNYVRPSALGWCVEPDLRVRFYGAVPVMVELTRRYLGWSDR